MELRAKRVYREGDGFFGDLITLLGTLTCYFFTVDAVRQQYIPVVNTPKHPFEMNGIAIQKKLVFFPFDLVQALAIDTWPSKIEIHERTGSVVDPSFTLSSEGHKSLAAQIIEASFLRYFEAHAGRVRRNHGHDPASWPPVWNFARVVRNAFAHGGEIYFRNPSADAVSWENATFGPSDNGHTIMFNNLATGDVIYLMDDMSSFI